MGSGFIFVDVTPALSGPFRPLRQPISKLLTHDQESIQLTHALCPAFFLWFAVPDGSAEKHQQARINKKNVSSDLKTPCTTKWSLPVLMATISFAVLPISSGAMPTSILVCTSRLSWSDSFFWTWRTKQCGSVRYLSLVTLAAPSHLLSQITNTGAGRHRFDKRRPD